MENNNLQQKEYNFEKIRQLAKEIREMTEKEQREKYKYEKTYSGGVFQENIK